MGKSTHLQLLDVLQLLPSIKQFPIPKLSTLGRQQAPDENLWILSMVLMLGNLSRPSGSSKLDIVKSMGKRKLVKDVENKYCASGIYLKFFLSFFTIIFSSAHHVTTLCIFIQWNIMTSNTSGLLLDAQAGAIS